MVLVCESRSGPSHVTVARQAVSTLPRTVVCSLASTCRCSWAVERDGTRTRHPGTSLSTRCPLGNAAS